MPPVSDCYVETVQISRGCFVADVGPKMQRLNPDASKGMGQKGKNVLKGGMAYVCVCVLEGIACKLCLEEMHSINT